MFHQHYTSVDTMQKKSDQKIFVENLHAAYTYPLHYLHVSWRVYSGVYNDASELANGIDIIDVSFHTIIINKIKGHVI